MRVPVNTVAMLLPVLRRPDLRRSSQPLARRLRGAGCWHGRRWDDRFRCRCGAGRGAGAADRRQGFRQRRSPRSPGAWAAPGRNVYCGRVGIDGAGGWAPVLGAGGRWCRGWQADSHGGAASAFSGAMGLFSQPNGPPASASPVAAGLGGWFGRRWGGRNGRVGGGCGCAALGGLRRRVSS